MKKTWILILVAVLCMMLPAAALAVQAYWGEGYGDYSSECAGSGTLQEAFDAAETTTDIRVIWLNEGITDAQYVIKGGNFQLDFDGQSVTAASGKSAFTVIGTANVDFDVYQYENNKLYGSEACITVDSENAVVTLGGEYDSDFHAASGKPAVILKAGTLYVDKYAYFTNSGAASCDILYQGGKLDLSNKNNKALTVANQSGKDLAPNVMGADGILLSPGAALLENGAGAATFENGKTYVVSGFGAIASVSVKTAAGSGSLPDGYYVTNNGTSAVYGTPPATLKGYIWYKDGVLTLNHFVGEQLDIDYGTAIINLVGSSTLVSDGDVIDADEANLIIQGSGSLEIITQDDVDGIDITDGDLTIKSGTVTINAQDRGIEIDREEAEAGVGQFFMTGGTLNITAGDEGIDAEEGITVSGGNITITAVHQGMDSSESLLISGGTVNITALEEDGIEASDALTITGGTVRSTSYCCGLYADDILVSGGHLAIYTRAADGWAMSAENSLIIHNKGDRSVVLLPSEWGDRLTLVDENGIPLSVFVDIPDADLPVTGDNTPIALLCALMLLSLASVMILRRRSA